MFGEINKTNLLATLWASFFWLYYELLDYIIYYKYQWNIVFNAADMNEVHALQELNPCLAKKCYYYYYYLFFPFCKSLTLRTWALRRLPITLHKCICITRPLIRVRYINNETRKSPQRHGGWSDARVCFHEKNGWLAQKQ